MNIIIPQNLIFADTLKCSGERIWASLMHDAIKRDKGQVWVYLFTSCKKTLIKRYPFMLHCTEMEEIDSFTNIFHKITNLSEVEGSTIFLDSVDIISLDSSFNQLIVFLKEISRYATVIARVHDECISTQNWEKLSSVSDITYSLELKNMIPSCTTVSYKTDGKRIVKVGTIYIDDSFRLIFKQYKAQNSNTFAEKSDNLLMPESSFDIGLRLKKSELEAKERVSLPYEAAQKEEELVRLRVRENRKIRAGGRIIYTPDEADDFDESDPDDDLEI
uniref:Elongator complex protein 5 n=1 Tax=Onchocerca volvulus TaxID=6282 RepID=A0A8R1U3B9_ONCVO